MRHAVLMALCLLAASVAAAGAEKPDALADARLLYNQRLFDATIMAAEQIRATPGRADSADLLAARAYLERFRASAQDDDLERGRQRLRDLDPRRLVPAERVEYVVGLGEALYLEQEFGAAAGLFASCLDFSEPMADDARDRVLDWWASALDHDRRPRGDAERQAVYDAIRGRMARELSDRPASTTAPYWLVVAARGKGDLQGAWDAAEAAWVRAPLTTDRGAALRGDLDRLMQRAIVPERARAVAQSPDALRQQWERFKERWSR